MKKMNKYSNIILMASLLLIPFLPGCYKDLGNYNYQDVPWLSIEFLGDNYTVRQDSSLIFRFEQPVKDTVNARVMVKVTGESLHETDLEYCWYRNDDTIRLPYLEVKLPPKQKFKTSYILRVTDKRTGLQYFRSVDIQTLTPFINSWFVLHGKENNRKIGSAQRDDSYISVIDDAYKKMNDDNNPFVNATALSYIRMGTTDYRNYGPELLLVASGDSLYGLRPFGMKIYKRYERMVPSGIYPRPKFYTTRDDQYRVSFFNDDQGRAYFSCLFGFLYPVHPSEDNENYRIDKVGISSEQPLAVMWDNTHKKFYYYQYNPWITFTDNVRNDEQNWAQLLTFPEDAVSQAELDDIEVLTIFPSYRDYGEVAFNALSINSRKEVYNYQTVLGEETDLRVEKYLLPGIELQYESRFAYSDAFENQFFYTNGASLYSYDMTNQESTLIYTAPTGSTIQKVMFRLLREFYRHPSFTYQIGLAINYSDRGEVVELELGHSGDVVNQYVYAGFGPIVDMVFAADEIDH